MRRTKWAAAAIAVIALGAGGCGTSDAGTGEATAPASPRPKGTGPLTWEVVRTDLDTSAADADLPRDPRHGLPVEKRARDGLPGSCGVMFKGFGTKSTPIDIARYEAVLGELRERDWKQRGDRVESKDKGGVISEARVVLKQRGWTMVTEYRMFPSDVVVTLAAFEDECMKKNAAGAGPIG